MDLISAAEHAEIRAAFQDVADTFHKSTIDYMRSVGVFDIRNEDREAKTDYQHYNIPCLVEFESFDRDKITEYQDSSGNISKAEVLVQILYDNLITMGLTTVDNGVVFNQETDKFVHKGRLYKVVYVGLDGPMEDKNILVKVYGDPEVRPGAANG